eukprot:jgi/Astpho2/5844/e_gw1.00080.60.1_t
MQKPSLGLHQPPATSVLALQKPSLALCFCICALVILGNLRAGDQAAEELFYIYYQPLIPVIIMVWLWGIVVRYFERNTVKYDVCFPTRDQKFLLSSRQVFQAAGLITAVVVMSAAAFTTHAVRYQGVGAAPHPPLVYAVLLGFLLLPINFAFPDSRMFFAHTLFRVITPFREVTWSDFLLADVLTSLAKPLSDAERAVCHLLTGPVMLPASTVCGSSSWLIAFTLCLPYVWRLCQCIRVYRDTGARPQLFNALKYSTAFPVIILSSMKYHVTLGQWNSAYKPLWLLSACLNSGYSYYWDIERDWEISFFSSSSMMGVRKPVLKEKLLYHKAFYTYLMLSNLVLRLSWTYKLSPHLRRNHFTVLMFTLLEVFRRFQWMFVRIEVELRKLQHNQPELGQLVPDSNGTTKQVDII